MIPLKNNRLLLVFVIVSLILIVSSIVSMGLRNPIFSEEFINDELNVVNGENIDLPGSNIEITDHLIINDVEHPISSENIDNILVKKETKELNGITKIIYGFKNFGPKSDIQFVWKNKIDIKYNKINEFSLSDSFTTNEPELKLYNNNVYSYFLTFEDVKTTFGGVTLNYDSKTRILTAISDPMTLMTGDEVIMDPGGGSNPTITLNAPANNSLITADNYTIIDVDVIDDQDPIWQIELYGSSLTNPTSAELLNITKNLANNTALYHNWTSPVLTNESDMLVLIHFDNRSEYTENGTYAYDFTGRENNCTINPGGPDFIEMGGKFGSAYNYTGVSDDYSSIPDKSELNLTTDFTIEVWVYDQSGSATTTRTIAHKGVSPNINWMIQVLNNPQKVRFLTQSSGDNIVALTTDNWTKDQWVHIAAVYNGTHGLLYMNGELVATDAGDTPLADRNPIEIGRYGADQYWIGMIDEFAIWNRSLTATEIKDHYRLKNDTYFWYVKADDGTLTTTSDMSRLFWGVNPSIPTLSYPANITNFSSGDEVFLNLTVTDNDNAVPLVRFFGTDTEGNTGLLFQNTSMDNNSVAEFNWSIPAIGVDSDTILLYHMDNRSDYDENDTFVYDYAGNYNGTIEGNPVFDETSNEILAGVLDLDGTNDSIRVSDCGFSCYGIKNLTYMMWLKPENPTGTNAILGSFYSSGPTNLGFYIFSDGVGELIILQDSYTPVLSQESFLTTGEWTHLGVVIIENSTVIVYKNGTEVQRSTNLTAVTDVSSFEDFHIGNLATDNPNLWKGDMDEVVIINRSLTDYEILNAYRMNDGDYNWFADAGDSDISNPTLSEVRGFEIDTTNPLVTASATSYPSGQTKAKNNDTVTLNATVTDDSGTGVQTVTVNADVIGCSPTLSMIHQGGDIYTADCVLNYTGSGDITVSATDFSGNSNNSISLTVDIDNTLPIITIISPVNTTYGNTTFDISVVANDSTTEWWYEYNNNGTNYTFIPNTTLVIGDSGGNKNLTVYANDSANNTGSSTVYFTIDTTPPTVTNILVNDSDIKSNDQIQINVTVTDTNRNSSDVYVTGDSGTTNVSMALLTGDIFQTITTPSSLGCSEGICTLTIYATDDLGNINYTETTSITVDDTLPLITIINPENITYSNTTIDLDVTADESIDTWWYEYNSNGTNYTFTPNTTLVASGGDGSKSLIVYANDTAGNKNSTSVYFTIDTVLPTIEFVSPTPQSGNRSLDWVYVNITTNDSSNHSTFVDWNNSLVGWWSFDYSNSTHVYDNSTNSNHGRFDGTGFTQSDLVQGIRGKAAKIENEDSIIIVENDPNLNITDEITIETWVKGTGSNFSSQARSETGKTHDYFPEFQVFGDKIYYSWLVGSSPYQVWTAEMYTNGSGWNETLRLTDDAWIYAPNLHVTGDKIYYAWYQEEPASVYQVWTAETYLNGSSWNATQRTNNSYTSGSPELQVVGDKVYYVFIDNDGSNYQLWKAEMYTNGSGWNATQILSTPFDSYNSKFQIVDDKMYIVYIEKDSSDIRQVWTGEMYINGSGWNATNRTSGSLNSRNPRMQVAGDKIYYSFVQEDSFGENQLWTSEMYINGSGWNAIKRTSLSSNGIYTSGGDLQVVGDKIYFSYYDDTSPEEIYFSEMNIDGSGWREIYHIDNANRNWYPSIDVVGGKIYIAYYARYGSNWDVTSAEIGSNIVNKGDAYGIGIQENNIIGFIDAGMEEVKDRSNPINYSNGATVNSTIDSDWNHIVMTYNRSVLNLYVNGVLKDTQAFTQPIHTNPYDLLIGDNLNGSVDEVKVWNRVLSGSEINSSYQSGTYRLETNLTSLGEGDYNFTGYVIDAAGNSNQTSTHTVTIDIVIPTITISSPINTTYSSTLIDLNVSADENIDTWWYEYNNNGTNYTFTPNTTLVASGGDGARILAVYANDSSGNENFSTIYFTIDTTLPNIKMINPPNLSNYNTSSITLNVSLSEQGSWCGISINNEPNITMDKNTSSTGFGYVNSSISDSNYNYLISCNDTVGNMNNTGYYMFLVDTLNPNISYGSGTDSDASTKSESNITINLTTYDQNDHYSFTNFNNSLVLWMTMDAENSTGPLDISGNNNDGTSYGNANQTYSGFFGKGFEFDGNGDYIDTDFHIDNSSGYGTISVWARISETNTSWQMIVADSSEAGNQVNDDGISLLYRSNSFFIYAYNGTGHRCSMNLLGSPTPGKLYHLVATHNNTVLTGYLNGTEINSITCNGSKKKTTNSMKIGSFTNGNTFFFNGTIDDLLIFNRSLSSQEVSSLFNSSSNSYYNTFTGLNDGSYTFTGYVVDKAGNSNYTSSRTVTIDNNIPEVTIFSPTNSTYSTTVLELNVSASESIDVWKYQYNNNGTNYTFTPNTTIVASGGDGSKNLTVYANDSAGNENSSIVYFTIDTTAPEILIHSPENTTYPTTILELNVSASESIDTWLYQYNNNGTNYSFTPNTTLITSGGDGSKNLTVYANDSLGIENSSIVYFTIETDLPTISLLINDTTPLFGNDSVRIDWNVSDTSLNYSIANITYPNNTLLSESQDYNTDFILTPDNLTEIGTYTVTVYVNDSFGNENSTQQTFNVINNNTAPYTSQLHINSTSLSNYSSDNISCFVLGIDNESLALTAYYRWYRNQSLVSSGSSSVSNNTMDLVSTLSYTETNKTDNWTCSVLMSDGSANETSWNNISISIINSPPNTNSPKTYDTSLTQTVNFDHGDTVVIRVNVTDYDGLSDLSSVKLNISSPGGLVLTNADMTYLTPISYGGTYGYNHTISQESAGVWNYTIVSKDLSGIESQSTGTFNVDISLTGDYKFHINLTINNTVNKVYVPGVGELDSNSLGSSVYTSPPNFYLSSYLNNNLKGLVFSQKTPVSISARDDNSKHYLSIEQNLPNSRAFLVFTKGQNEDIQNRMELIESGKFLSQTSPTFSYGLGDNEELEISLEYPNIDIENNLSIKGKETILIIENVGEQNNMEVIHIETM